MHSAIHTEFACHPQKTSQQASGCEWWCTVRLLRLHGTETGENAGVPSLPCQNELTGWWLFCTLDFSYWIIGRFLSGSSEILSEGWWSFGSSALNWTRGAFILLSNYGFYWIIDGSVGWWAAWCWPFRSDRLVMNYEFVWSFVFRSEQVQQNYWVEIFDKNTCWCKVEFLIVILTYFNDLSSGLTLVIGFRWEGILITKRKRLDTCVGISIDCRIGEQFFQSYQYVWVFISCNGVRVRRGLFR